MIINRNKKKHSKSAWDYYWDYVAQTRTGKYITRIEGNFITQHLTALREKPEYILDAGAGSGRHEPMLTNFASWIIATEIEPSLVLNLAHAADNVLPLLVSAASESLPVADLSVDCVICLEVPKLSEEDWFYAECRRVLKPGGIMIINMTNRYSWKGVLAMLNPKRYGSGQWNYYKNSVQNIKRRLREHGFIVRSTIGLNWIPFIRDSDSPLVGFFATLENIMGLRKMVRWSPWVLLEANKETNSQVMQ
jgi:SAM-dependent methyltransferase